MVLITDDYLTNLFSGNSSERQKSNLTLPSRNVKRVELLKNHCRFQLIDLRNNYVETTSTLKNQTYLTYLFLQNNSIRRLEGFTSLRCLEALFLDFNRIEVVENIDVCPLKKLSVRGQRLPRDQSLAFDPKTMNSLSYRLEELNVSKNNLTTLNPIRYLVNLVVLDASENRLAQLRDLLCGVSKMCHLKTLSILGNPILSKKSAVKSIVASIRSLERLNGIEIPPMMHQCCEHMQIVFEKSGSPEREDGMSNELREVIEERMASIPEPMRPEVGDQKLMNIATNKRTEKKKNINK